MPGGSIGLVAVECVLMVVRKASVFAVGMRVHVHKVDRVHAVMLVTVGGQDGRSALVQVTYFLWRYSR